MYSIFDFETCAKHISLFTECARRTARDISSQILLKFDSTTWIKYSACVSFGPLVYALKCDPNLKPVFTISPRFFKSLKTVNLSFTSGWIFEIIIYAGYKGGRDSEMASAYFDGFLLMRITSRPLPRYFLKRLRRKSGASSGAISLNPLAE